MDKKLFSAVLVLAGATMTGSIVHAGSNNTNHSSGTTANSGCLPDTWTALDLNQDGYANEAEVEKAAPCIDFDVVDRSGDGHFSRVEFLNFQEAHSKRKKSGANENSGKSPNNACPPDTWTALDLNQDGYANEDEVEKAAPCIDFDTADRSGDGHFSRVEFLNFMEAKAKRKNNDASQGNGKSANKACPPDTWTALDLNQDGYANEDEVEKAAPCIDFDTADRSGDGHFSRVEFLTFKEGESNATPSDEAQRVGKPDAGQKLAQKQKEQKTGNAAGHIDQSQYDTPLALVTNVPEGELTNPFDPHNTAIAKEGHHLFQTYGCSGCHGGGGGGGMGPPLTDVIWSYGSEPDTLYRLITLGTKKLQAKYGYTRNMMQTIQGAMPTVGPTFGHHTKDIWKIITWIKSMHLEN